MLYYSGIVTMPYDSRMGPITRIKKEIELCHFCNTYQHMLAKKKEMSKKLTMCPKCRMVTIRYVSYPIVFVRPYEEDAIKNSTTVTTEERVKSPSFKSVDIKDNYIVIESMKYIKDNDFPTAKEIAEVIGVSYDKTTYWLNKMVMCGLLEKHAMPIELKNKRQGSVYYTPVSR